MSKADKIRVGSSESLWQRIYSLVITACQDGHVPSAEMWQKICGAVEKAAVDKDSQDAHEDGEDNVPGSVEESRRKLTEGYRDKFEQDGFSPEQAQRMAEDAANVPLVRNWP